MSKPRPLDDKSEKPPLFAEKCDFCEYVWATDAVQFVDVILKGYKPVHRACPNCVKAMYELPENVLEASKEPIPPSKTTPEGQAEPEEEIPDERESADQG